MDIFVTGGTGFVGRALCRELLRQGHQLRCLVRPGSESRLIASPQAAPVIADLFSPEQLTPLLKGADAVIHLVGIIREIGSKGVTFKRMHQEATASVISATHAAGVKRYLHMSANGTRSNAISVYHQTKFQAEEIVRHSPLDWTIFRPSLIYGPEDQFINLLATLIRRLPVVPVIGPGDYCMQPVPVSQVVAGFGRALDNKATWGKTYHCGGKDCVSYVQLLDLVGDALGIKKVRKFYQPLALMRPVISLMEKFPFFPMTGDQLQMLLEGNCCDTRPWLEDLGLSPAALAGELDYLSAK